MGCRRLFDCFRRARDDRSTTDSVSQLSRGRGHDSKNRLSNLFLSQENAASSPCRDTERSGFDSMRIDKDQKDEAQFLKAYGTTPAAQIEIGKASEKLETPQHAKTDQLFEEVSEQTPSSCLTDTRNSARISTGFSEESQESIGTAFRDKVDRTGKLPLAAGNITGKTKSVVFEFDVDQSYSSTSSKSEMAEKTNILATSSSPTSSKLSDEIQTTGSISPAVMESAVKGKPRISSQYVHPASSLSNLLEDSDEKLQQAKHQACKEKTETESTASVTFGGNSDETSSLSPRVKQSQEKSKTNIPITSWDKPIIGMVAAHWNEKDQTEISPKWWDGNGIPNSTNKYKEDQKVSWHATPFEERLEKALSEESGQSFISPRKFGIMEDTERDTAISKLQHSPQFKSVVSF